MLMPLLLSGFLAASPVIAASPPLASQPVADLEGVVASDGIDEYEAMRIADVYFAINAHCGQFSGVSDGGLIWVVHAQSTFSGNQTESFGIDKTAGRIQSESCASYEKPADILRIDPRPATD